jgi:hypothetical protein
VRFQSGDHVLYQGQFDGEAYEGVVQGLAGPAPTADEPTYLLTLLAGPYAGHTSVVYEGELRLTRAATVSHPTGD